MRVKTIERGGSGQVVRGRCVYRQDIPLECQSMPMLPIKGSQGQSYVGVAKVHITFFHLLHCSLIAVLTYCTVHLLHCSLIAVFTYCSVHLLHCSLIALFTYCTAHLLQCSLIVLLTYCTVHLLYCSLIALYVIALAQLCITPCSEVNNCATLKYPSNLLHGNGKPTISHHKTINFEYY